ncbi:MAG: anthranilate phosphoribosyltransferase [Candidatus Hydrothermarchaeota archaeon]|nr:anthranilate phosphoribosyltransferase [Candidatus Hydrothermarchaeota archaeon]
MKEFIGKLVEGKDLTSSEAGEAMKLIMSGTATGAQIGGFLTALRMKGESIEEITACAKTMCSFASRINPKVNGTLVDTCGTGGDKIKTFNISTIAAFVVAGAGIYVAKHGNRSVTSKAGSADVLEALGVKIDLPPKEVEKCIEKIGIGFMFAPLFHPAMKHAIGPRKEIGIRTVFNVLGPLTNPANAKAQLLGVYDAALTEKMAGVLGNLGVERAVVVHGLDGLDELSTIGMTQISELSGSKVKTYKASPEGFGFRRASIGDIAGGDASSNAKVVTDVLKGEKGPKRDIVVLNAAAGIYVGGRADSIKEGISIAEKSLDSGAAYEKLVALIKESRCEG